VDTPKKVEKIRLEDGRWAERHTTVNGDQKVVEVFSEDKRPMKIEKRIVETSKNVVAERRVETLKDGEVVDVQIHSIEPNVRMELREHLGVAPNPELNAQGLMTKKDIVPLVTEAVVAGVRTMMQNQSPKMMSAQSIIVPKAMQSEELLEQRVAAKSSTSPWFFVLAGVGIVANVVLAYLYFM
jgi:hypothetical protein